MILALKGISFRGLCSNPNQGSLPIKGLFPTPLIQLYSLLTNSTGATPGFNNPQLWREHLLLDEQSDYFEPCDQNSFQSGILLHLKQAPCHKTTSGLYYWRCDYTPLEGGTLSADADDADTRCTDHQWKKNLTTANTVTAPSTMHCLLFNKFLSTPLPPPGFTPPNIAPTLFYVKVPYSF